MTEIRHRITPLAGSRYPHSFMRMAVLNPDSDLTPNAA